MIVVGWAEIVKLLTPNCTVTVCESGPFAAVTVTVYEPELAEQLRLEFAIVPKVTVAGDSEQVSPVEGDIEVDRLTGPAKFSKLVTVRVELPDVLGLRDIDVGDAVMVKSLMKRETGAEFLNPEYPVAVPIAEKLKLPG